jgi:hypothetical protein
MIYGCKNNESRRCGFQRFCQKLETQRLRRFLLNVFIPSGLYGTSWQDGLQAPTNLVGMLFCGATLLVV